MKNSIITSLYSKYAETIFGTVKTAGSQVADTAIKITKSEPVQTLSQKVSITYNNVMNSETVQNISKKAEEQYVSLKNKLSHNNNISFSSTTTTKAT